MFLKTIIVYSAWRQFPVSGLISDEASDSFQSDEAQAGVYPESGMLFCPRGRKVHLASARTQPRLERLQALKRLTQCAEAKKSVSIQ